MNHGTKVSVTAQPNGDLTLENDDGSITIRQDGTIILSTVAAIELSGEAMGRLDTLSGINDRAAVVEALRLVGKKRQSGEKL